MHERAEDAHARCAERVPDRDRAAVDVDERGVALELVDHGDRLSGEGLIDLDKRQVADLPARPGKRFGHGRNRPDAHVVRMHPGRCSADVSGHRLDAGRGQGTFGHQQQPGRAVVQPGRVTASHRAAGAEGRLLGREFGRGQVRSDSLVAPYLAVRRLHRDDLGVEPAASRSRRGPLMAAQRELVLPGPVDLVLAGDVLGGLAQADRGVKLGHARADQPPAEPGVRQAGVPGEDLGGPRQDERSSGHRLGTARDADVGVTGGDGPGRREDRLHA